MKFEIKKIFFKIIDTFLFLFSFIFFLFTLGLALHLALEYSIILFILLNLLILYCLYWIFVEGPDIKAYISSIFMGLIAGYVISFYQVVKIKIVLENKDTEPVKKETVSLKNNKKLNKYKSANIEEKILILKSSGLSQNEIENKLKNNMEFRELIKNGDEKLKVILKL